MNQLFKLSATLPVLLILTACVSAGAQNRIGSSGRANTPPEIAYAPAIDVSYAEVLSNVGQHVGVNVRWGGQIVKSESIANGRRLTVFAYPLNNKGKPDQKPNGNFDGGRFIVEIEGETADGDELEQRYITVYGTVSGGFKLTNGPKQKIIPVLAALETIEWDTDDRKRYYARDYGYAYHGLALRYGHYGHPFGFYGHPYFGYRYSYYPRRGHRRHGRHH